MWLKNQQPQCGIVAVAIMAMWHINSHIVDQQAHYIKCSQCATSTATMGKTSSALD